MLLEDNAFVPDDLIPELKNCINCHAKDLDDLARHVDNFNYPKAMAVLEKIMCAQGHNLTG